MPEHLYTMAMFQDLVEYKEQTLSKFDTILFNCDTVTLLPVQMLKRQLLDTRENNQIPETTTRPQR